jgi:hypothetical protein
LNSVRLDVTLGGLVLEFKPVGTSDPGFPGAYFSENRQIDSDGTNLSPSLKCFTSALAGGKIHCQSRRAIVVHAPVRGSPFSTASSPTAELGDAEAVAQPVTGESV